MWQLYKRYLSCYHIQITYENSNSGLPARDRFELIVLVTVFLFLSFVWFVISSVGFCSADILCTYCSANDHTVHPELRGGYLAFTLQVFMIFQFHLLTKLFLEK
jgi:nitrate reductase NapE component